MENVTMSRRLHKNPHACGRVLEDTDWYGMVKHRAKRLSVADLSRELEHYARTIFCPIRVTSYWARWRLKSLALPLCTQSFIQAQIKEHIKAPRYWPLRGEFTGDRSALKHVSPIEISDQQKYVIM